MEFNGPKSKKTGTRFNDVQEDAAKHSCTAAGERAKNE